MKVNDEKILFELLRKNKINEKNITTEDSTELLVAGIAYASKLRPNLTYNNPLSIQEMLCLILLATGKNPDKCADLLGISAKTIKTYEQRIRGKLGARNRTNALYLAQIRGFISLV